MVFTRPQVPSNAVFAVARVRSVSLASWWMSIVSDIAKKIRFSVRTLCNFRGILHPRNLRERKSQRGFQCKVDPLWLKTNIALSAGEVQCSVRLLHLIQVALVLALVHDVATNKCNNNKDDVHRLHPEVDAVAVLDLSTSQGHVTMRRLYTDRCCGRARIWNSISLASHKRRQTDAWTLSLSLSESACQSLVFLLALLVSVIYLSQFCCCSIHHFPLLSCWSWEIIWGSQALLAMFDPRDMFAIVHVYGCKLIFLQVFRFPCGGSLGLIKSL